MQFFIITMSGDVGKGGKGKERRLQGMDGKVDLNTFQTKVNTSELNVSYRYRKWVILSVNFTGYITFYFLFSSFRV